MSMLRNLRPVILVACIAVILVFFATPVLRYAWLLSWISMSSASKRAWARLVPDNLSWYAPDVTDSCVSVGFDWLVQGAGFSGDSKRFMACWNGVTEPFALVYSTDEWRPLRKLVLDDTSNAVFSPGGDQLVAGSGKAVVQSVEDGEPLASFPDRGEFLPVFSPDGVFLAICRSSGEFELWDTQAWKLVKSYSVARCACLKSVQFTPDGRTLVWGDGRLMRFMDLGSGAETTSFTAYRQSIMRLTSNRKGGILVSVGNDDGPSGGVVKVWDPNSRTLLASHKVGYNFPDKASGAVVMPGHEDVIVCGDVFWNWRRQATAPFKGSGGEFVAASPNGRWLAAGWGRWVDIVSLQKEKLP